jgi:hypothetical protein
MQKAMREAEIETKLTEVMKHLIQREWNSHMYNWPLGNIHHNTVDSVPFYDA